MAKNRVYYLLDASTALHHYIPHKKITPHLDHIIEQHGLKRAFIYIPQFCISETFNTFAKFHYRRKETYPQKYQELYLKNIKPLPLSDYKQICENFKADIKFGKLFYNYELSRYHIFNADHIITFEHQIELVRKKPRTGEEEPWFMSTFDILIIAMGIELARMHGENMVYILTCDKRIKTIADSMKRAIGSNGGRKKYGIPDHITIPNVFYLYNASIKDYPKFAGQSRY